MGGSGSWLDSVSGSAGIGLGSLSSNVALTLTLTLGLLFFFFFMLSLILLVPGLLCADLRASGLISNAFMSEDLQYETLVYPLENSNLRNDIYQKSCMRTIIEPQALTVLRSSTA